MKERDFVQAIANCERRMNRKFAKVLSAIENVSRAMGNANVAVGIDRVVPEADEDEMVPL